MIDLRNVLLPKQPTCFEKDLSKLKAFYRQVLQIKTNRHRERVKQTKIGQPKKVVIPIITPHLSSNTDSISSVRIPRNQDL
jgi:hypothetical protein